MNNLEQYFLQTMNKIGEINEVDEFAKLMLNIIKNGNVELNYKRLTETKVFDDLWIKTFESYFVNIDNIIRNPRKVLNDEAELVPVELARNVSSKTVQHLAQHSQYIKDIDKNGVIIPSKVLSIRREDYYGIYENRFIKTLINRLFSFIRRRYDVIMENSDSYTSDLLEVVSSYNILNKDSGIEELVTKDGNYQDVNFKLDISVRSELKDEKLKKKNEKLLERINNLYRTVKGFKISNFMQMMEKFPEVLSPIQKTNIILKNVDFKSAHKLWIFLDHYSALGFDAVTEEETLSLGNNYQADIYSLILLSYVTTGANEEKRNEKYPDIDYQKRLISNPQIDLPGGYALLTENGELTEYFLNQSLVNYTLQYKQLRASGKTEKAAIDTILTDIYQMIDTVAKYTYKIADDSADALTEFYNPKDLEIDEQIRIINDKKEVLSRIIKVKESNLVKTKKDHDNYLKQIKRLEKTKADREERRLKQLEVAKAKAELLKEYKKQVAEEQERNRKRLEKIAKEERLKEAKRIKAKMQKEKAKEAQRIKAKIQKEKAKERERLKKEKEKQKKLAEKARASSAKTNSSKAKTTKTTTVKDKVDNIKTQ